MNRVKLLHLTEDLGMGGLEKVVYHLSTGMDPARFDVRVWCLTKGGVTADRLAERGLRPEILGMGPRPALSFVWRLAARLRREGIGIIHTHGYSAGVVGRLAAVLARTPVVLAHVHTTYDALGPKQFLIDRFLGFFTDRVICCSRAVASSLEELEGLPARKLRVIYNGTPRLLREPPKGLREKLGISPKDAILLCAASLTANKGHRYLVDALALVARKFPDTVLLLAGDGPLKSSLQEQAERLGLGRRVIFAGVCPEIGDLLAICDIAVLATSEREGMSLWLAEAMSAAKPLVAAAIGGVPEILIDRANGLLAAPRDAAALARAILEILYSPALARDLSQTAEKMHLERFTLEKMTAAVAAVYEECHV